MSEESTEGHEHEWAVVCLGCDAMPNVADHFVTFDAEGWYIEHSLACRMSGEMKAGCRFQSAIRSIADLPDAERMGYWRITAIDAMGLPSLERAEIK